ncbi:MAG: hypothetical protein QW303_03725 [Nitrososphaerota archaeon]
MIHKKIRGPVNVLRLEGSISGNVKVIYFFMDYHEYPSRMLNSADMMVENVDEYMENFLYRLNQKKESYYDFFVEIMLTNIINKKFKVGARYIDKIHFLFNKLFSYDFDAKTMKIKNVGTKNLEKIRMHYVDIRDYINFGIYTNYVNILATLNVLDTKMMTYEIDDLLDLFISLTNNFSIFYKQIEKLYETLVKHLAKKPIMKHCDDLKEFLLEYMIYKIKYKYDDEMVRSEINEIVGELSERLHALSNESKRVSERINEHLKAIVTNLTSGQTIMLNLVYKIKDSINLCMPIIDEFLACYSCFVDIYLLRRFLEKKYITNVIAYIGCDHGVNCIDILVKRFNFKITNACYFNATNIDDLNSKVLNGSSRTETDKLIVPSTPKNQMVDLYSFPESIVCVPEKITG